RWGHQTQGSIYRRRDLLAPFERLHRSEYSRHSRHQRLGVPDSGVRDGRAEDPAELFQLVANLRRLRRSVGSAGRCQLVLHEGTRPPSEWRVHLRPSQSRWVHGVPDARWRERADLSCQSRNEFLTEAKRRRSSIASVVRSHEGTQIPSTLRSRFPLSIHLHWRSDSEYRRKGGWPRLPVPRLT